MYRRLSNVCPSRLARGSLSDGLIAMYRLLGTSFPSFPGSLLPELREKVTGGLCEPLTHRVIIDHAD